MIQCAESLCNTVNSVTIIIFRDFASHCTLGRSRVSFTKGEPERAANIYSCAETVEAVPVSSNDSGRQTILMIASACQ